MKVRLDFRGWRFYIALTHSGQVVGVNSRLSSGKHFLMWDFDGVQEEDVKQALGQVQKRFRLSRVFLLNTGLADSWHAYCFKSFEFPDVLRILAWTQFLDKVFFKIGVIRGYWTLRYTAKRGRNFKPALILPSRVKEDVDPFQLHSFTKYWTRRL